MDYSNLTKEQIIEGTKSKKIIFSGLSEEQKDNKDLILILIQQNAINLIYASERLQNDKDCLSAIEKKCIEDILSTLSWNENTKKWYKERMNTLINIREKDMMEESIITNNKSSKKLKF